MAAFEQLDAHLAKRCSDDAWEDDALDRALERAAAFGEADWKALEATWPDRPSQWQVRCAQTLSSADPSRAPWVLIEMVERGDDELAVAAADSLREHAAALELRPPARARLEAIAAARGGPTATVIGRLLERLDARR